MFPVPAGIISKGRSIPAIAEITSETVPSPPATPITSIPSFWRWRNAFFKSSFL